MQKRKFTLATAISLSLYSLLSFKYLFGFENILSAYSTQIFFLLTTLILLALIFIYIKLQPLIADGAISYKAIILSAVLFNMVLLPALFPKQSWDIYSYINLSRVQSVFHENSYIQSYASYPNDVLYPVLVNKWSNLTNVYGPLFTLIGWALGIIAGDNLFINIMLYKIFFIALNILNIFIIKKITHSPKIVFLYAWNPYLLYEFSLKAHLDIIQISLILAGLLFYLNYDKLKTYLLSSFFIFSSVFIKYISVVLVPFYFFSTIKNLPNNKKKLTFTVANLTLGLLLLFVLFYPFWEGPIILQTLYDMASHSIDPFLVSPAIFFFSLYLPTSIAILLSRIIFFVLYLALFLYFLLTKNKKVDIIKYMVAGLGLFLLTFFTWFMPWYLTTFIVLLILYYDDKKPIIAHIVNGLSIYCILFYLILR